MNGIWAPAPGDALTPFPSPKIEVDDLVNDDSGNVWMQSANGHIDGGTGTAVTPHYWGTFYWRDNWQKVTILNHSNRDLVIDNIDPINRDVNLHPRVKENAPGGSLADAKFSIVRQVDPTLITITNDHTSGPNLLINGFINNPIGQTDVTSQFGPITASTIRGGSSSVYPSVPANAPHTQPDPLEHPAPLRRYEHRRLERLRLQPRRGRMRARIRSSASTRLRRA